jgi:hypothetical protein
MGLKMQDKHKTHNEGFALVISLFAMAFTGWQAWEGHRSLELANRPYLAVESASVKYDWTSSDQAGDWESGIVSVEFKAYGNTPALNLSLEQGCSLVQEDSFSDLDKDPPRPEIKNVLGLPAVLLPNASRTLESECRAETPGHTLRKDSFPRVIVAGKVIYYDIFKQKHITGFCYWGRLYADPKVFPLKPCYEKEQGIT